MSFSESTRAAKRQRVDANSAEPSIDAEPSVDTQQSIKAEINEDPKKKYLHHETYWVKEGNMIIVAEGGPDPVAFKIFSSVLADNSPVLAKLVADVDKTVTYCDCPILFLEEPAIDIEAVLQWLFSKAFNLSLPKQMSLKHVFAFHRLGIEYELEDMGKEAIARLETCFPASYSDYMQAPVDTSPDRPIVFTNRQEFDVIAFCSINDLHSPLPAAFFDCCSYPLREMYMVDEDISDYGKTIDGMAPWHWASHCVMLGYSLLSTAKFDRTRTLLQGDTDPSCAKPSSCRATLKAVAGKIFSLKHKDIFLPIDLSDLESTSNGMQRPCSLCWSLQVKKWDEALHKVWDDLPTIFHFKDKAPPAES